MEITIQINGQAVPVEVSIEVYTYLDQAAHKDENWIYVNALDKKSRKTMPLF